MTAGLRFFYRHIHVTGLHNIPSNGPAIIIANHNSSLMDAALMGILLKRKAFFFARGDVFINKPVQRLLWWLHMMPVHGHQGGKKTLGANNSSFSSGQQILSKGGIIVFFPESYSHTEHQLLPFRKGVFRLAFDTAVTSDFSFDIPIVPIGISYEHPVDCRKDVLVHAGKPISLLNYKNEYNTNAAAALLHICKDAYRATQQLVLHIEDRSSLQLTEEQLAICRNNTAVPPHRWKIFSAAQLLREQQACSKINDTDEAGLANIKTRFAKYFTALQDAGLNDKTITPAFSFPSWKKFLLWAGFPVYLFGLLFNGLPVLIARQLANKKVSRKDFYSWIFVACYSILYFLWLLLLLALSFLFNWKFALALPLLVIPCGIFAYVYKDWLHDRRQHRNWHCLTRPVQQEILAMRASLQM